MDQPSTRQELYERVRRVGRQGFILEQMVRLGFWPTQGVLPEDPADEIRRQSEIQQELSKLRSENRKLYNEEALLKELRKKRFAESRKKRQETKERRERERRERAEEWRKKKEQEIVYLGPKVSGGLNNYESDEGRLKQNNLPRFDKPEEIAAAMGISVNKLRFLAFDRKTSAVSHYIHFKLPKKTGGHRLISAPKTKLKAAQQWILGHILSRVTPHEAAHGFRRERNIVTNARPHLGARYNQSRSERFLSFNYLRSRQRRFSRSWIFGSRRVCVRFDLHRARNRRSNTRRSNLFCRFGPTTPAARRADESGFDKHYLPTHGPETFKSC
jgi:hypothetical protein